MIRHPRLASALAVLIAALGVGAFPAGALAEVVTATVRAPDGSLTMFEVDIVPGTPLEEIEVPQMPDGVVVAVEPASPPVPVSASSQLSPPPVPLLPDPSLPPPASDPAEPIGPPGYGEEAYSRDRPRRSTDPRRRATRRAHRRARSEPKPAGPSVGGGAPLGSIAGPQSVTGVPNFVIRNFEIPLFLLPIYQAAGIEYGVPWEVLAAINEIETGYGRNLNVSSAGAVGWMQFLPSSWQRFGVDANEDGRRDPYNPVDAIFAAARYLKEAGAEQDLRRAIFAYNHAEWYVDGVLERARALSAIPADLVGSLTGLTEGRFPVAARARYARALSPRAAEKRFRRDQNAARVVQGDASRRDIEVFAREGSPVVAVNDGVVKRIGVSRRLGRFVVLQDVYGNRYTYGGLSSFARFYPVSRRHGGARGGQAVPTRSRSTRRGSERSRLSARSEGPQVADKPRLFAHPERPAARDAGALEQTAGGQRSLRRYTFFSGRRAKPIPLDPRLFRLERLRRGARVMAGTRLGGVGRPHAGRAAHLRFEIRPAGRGAPPIDPKPILDGWRLLESSAVYRPSGRSVLRGEDQRDPFSIGQILLLPKPLLEQRVLSDRRIELYECGRRDVRTGQVDRRVLAALAYLAESGLNPSVSSLRCGHSHYTKSGNVSHHSFGSAVDISAINGTPVSGNQRPGGLTEQAVRRLAGLQGTLGPDEIISLLDLGGPTMAMSDHDDHIHVGFRPLFGQNRRLGRQTVALLKPGQWHELIARVGATGNPRVPTRPSRFAVPADGAG